MQSSSDRLLLVIDLAGTALFALEGAMAAIRGGLDFFGVMVLSFAVALGGGVIRDLLIGAVPPAAIRDWRYPVVAFTSGTAIFFLFHYFVRAVPASWIMMLDAAALGLFAIAGTQKALAYRLNRLVAPLLGTITGVGGGTIRDVFLAQVPLVLRADVYATAALAGSVVYIAVRRLRIPRSLAALIGWAVCFLLRVVSVWRHWSLPRVLEP
ncbi:MAG TPA: trimeric intracellular cation channel family protein [Terriglobales bacterium]|nr:trimeric intracellular cation channel family protein [Terriglobales bacterium]